LSAVLAETTPVSAASVGVFTESYSALQRLPDRAKLLSNAMTVPGGESMQLLSGAKPGASGSAVLGNGGLLLGVVVERVAAGPGASGNRMLSMTAGGNASNASTQVLAIPVLKIRQFLLERNIPFTESDTAQLGAMQSPAARAMTLAAGVICG
jgi:hypothetical protein